VLHDLPGDQAERILILNLGKRDTGWPEEAAVLWKDDQIIDLGTLEDTRLRPMRITVTVRWQAL